MIDIHRLEEKTISFFLDFFSSLKVMHRLLAVPIPTYTKLFTRNMKKKKRTHHRYGKQEEYYRAIQFGIII
jgi:hypothetical protein